MVISISYRRAVANLTAMRSFVLSTRTLARTPLGAVVERMSGDPAEIVSQLAARGIQHVYVDGGIAIQGFLRADFF